MKEITINVPSVVNILTKEVVAIRTSHWDECFIEEAIKRAVKDFILLHTRAGTLKTGISLLESGKWSKRKAMAEENQLKRLEAARIKIAKIMTKLPPEERAKLIADTIGSP